MNCASPLHFCQVQLPLHITPAQLPYKLMDGNGNCYRNLHSSLSWERPSCWKLQWLGGYQPLSHCWSLCRIRKSLLLFPKSMDGRNIGYAAILEKGFHSFMPLTRRGTAIRRLSCFLKWGRKWEEINRLIILLWLQSLTTTYGRREIDRSLSDRQLETIVSISRIGSSIWGSQN